MKYFSSEIDPSAIKITQKNHPETIQIGDVRDVGTEYFGKVDLLIGGSLCQGFSFAGKQLNFNDDKSILFFEYVRILKAINPKYFILENVKMKQEYQDIISKYLGVKPIEINSGLVSAQQRKRLYWTNIPGIEQPEDKGMVLKDILHENPEDYIKISKKGIYKQYQSKMSCLTGGGHSGGNHSDMDLIGIKKPIRVGTAIDIKGFDCIKRIYSKYGKSPTLTTMQGGHRHPKVALNDYEYRRYTPIECERAQTLPDNYTEGVSNSQRYKALGNAWTVEVIKHIFSFLPKELLLNKDFVVCSLFDGISCGQQALKELITSYNTVEGKSSEAFNDWTREELIKFLEGTLESQNKLKFWLYKNNIKVLRQYEDEHLGGIRLHFLHSKTDNLINQQEEKK